jgi:hypothetical protein
MQTDAMDSTPSGYQSRAQVNDQEQPGHNRIPSDVTGREHEPGFLGGFASPPAIGQEDRRTQSAPDAINTVTKANHDTVPTSPLASPSADLQPRVSLQSPRAAHTHNIRPSEEFDRRYDGPFGRPSLAMARRQSLQPQLPGALELDENKPSNPTPDNVGPVGLGFQPEPPPLNYTLRTRKLAIALFWTVIVFDSVVMPIGLYFGLWYGVGPGNPADTRLSANTVFSVVTAAIGGASILEYFLRFWRLWKTGSTCRVSRRGRLALLEGSLARRKRATMTTNKSLILTNSLPHRLLVLIDGT